MKTRPCTLFPTCKGFRISMEVDMRTFWGRVVFLFLFLRYSLGSPR